MERFHPRRKEREIQSLEEIHQILKSQKYMTIACSKENVPYLFTVNYAYWQEKEWLYFHCAPIGKKIEFISSNPKVWGQVIVDQGQITGQCDYNYRSVHFQGEAEIVAEEKEKSFALELLIDQQEPDPESIKSKLFPMQINKVTVVKIKIQGLSGKEYKR